MKPRLQTAPLTDEDFAIWDFIASPYKLGPGIPEWRFIEADRRDADLMLSFVKFRALSQSYEQWHLRLASIGIPLEVLQMAWGYA